MHDERKSGLFGPFESISALFKGLLPDRRDPATVMAEAFAAVGTSTTEKRYVTSTDDNGLIIDVDLPGIAPRDVTLWATRTVVIVKHPTRGGSGVVTQRYTVSGDYDLSTTEASMADGRLRVRIARVKPVEPRRVAVEYAGQSAR